MSYQVLPCSRFSLAELAKAMNAAFSDYLVPMQLDEASFGSMMRQRGFDPEFSFAAVSSDGIGAIWLSGAPSWAYRNTAYTISTGTVPRHRRKGLLKLVFEAVCERLSSAGAAAIQLEVIAQNERALSAYLGFGFQHERDLAVYQIEKSEMPERSSPDADIRPISVSDLPESESDFFSSWPTPQNSRAALIAGDGRFTILGVHSDGELAGWGAIDAEAGTVAQLAIHPGHRRKGLGTSLLCALGRETERPAMVFANIDQSDTGVASFLGSLGGVPYLRQYEMVCRI